MTRFSKISSPQPSYIYSIAAIWLLASMVLSSCDNSVDPFGDTTANFGLFGFLDAAADTQFVRVEVRRESQSREDLEIPSMISRDMSSGMEETWQDSLVTLTTGEQGLLFWSAFTPEESGRYQLEVSNLNADFSTAMVEMPNTPVMTVDPAQETIAGTWEQRLIIGETATIPDRVTVRYVTSYLNGELFVKEVDYFSRFLTYGANTWSVITRIERDLDDIRIEGGFGDDEAIRFREASVILRLRSQEWLNGGSTNSNVENGFGFVGSVITFEERWPIEEEILTERNFRNEQ